MIYPLVLDLAADGIPVTVTCRVLGFSTQAFNKWRRNPVSQRDWDNAHLINAAMDIHGDDPAFGYRFIADELEAEGFVVSERRVWRLCSQQRLWSVFAKKRGLNKKAGPPVHDDLVDRDFTAERSDQLWMTDIERHEALCDRVGVEDLPRPACRSRPGEAGGSLIRETPVRVDSSPDNDGTGQHCQMVRVRQASSEGVREKPASESPSIESTGSNLADMGRAAVRT